MTTYLAVTVLYMAVTVVHVQVFDIDPNGQYAVHASFDSNATEMAIGSDKEGKKVCPLADCSMGSQ